MTRYFVASFRRVDRPPRALSPSPGPGRPNGRASSQRGGIKALVNAERRGMIPAQLLRRRERRPTARRGGPPSKLRPEQLGDLPVDWSLTSPSYTTRPVAGLRPDRRAEPNVTFCSTRTIVMPARAGRSASVGRLHHAHRDPADGSSITGPSVRRPGAPDGSIAARQPDNEPASCVRRSCRRGKRS